MRRTACVDLLLVIDDGILCLCGLVEVGESHEKAFTIGRITVAFGCGFLTVKEAEEEFVLIISRNAIAVFVNLVAMGEEQVAIFGITRGREGVLLLCFRPSPRALFACITQE